MAMTVATLHGDASLRNMVSSTEDSAANGLASCSTSADGPLHEPATGFGHTTR